MSYQQLIKERKEHIKAIKEIDKLLPRIEKKMHRQKKVDQFRAFMLGVVAPMFGLFVIVMILIMWFGR